MIRQHGRAWIVGLGAAAVGSLLAVAIGFTAARLSDEAEPRAAAEPATTTPGPRHPAVAVIDGYVIDTSDPNWQDPWLDAERAKPRYDQVLNGIAVGPTVRVEAPRCRGYFQSVDQAAKDPLLSIEPGYLPPSSQLESKEADGCADGATKYFLHYVIPGDLSQGEKVARREANWFEIQHGSYFHIIRRKQATPALQVSSIPAERWSAAIIGGKPAAVARPIIGSFGEAMVLVWDASAGVLTQVGGDNLALEELIRIAEGLQ